MGAGEKQNDLKNVGRPRRHHTFFEMLGNFSFGDYFKKEAIEYAWELVTKEYRLPVEKLYFTFFEGGLGVPKDEEARELWLRVGAPADRVRGGGLADNFWAMGETGPCGPCSEIHYDMGPEASDLGHPKCPFPCDCGRYVEIWNLVFMQYNRDAEGKLAPLPRPCVDTGMGLERVAAVIQGKVSNFETDLLWPLVEEAAELSGTDYGEKPEVDVSLRILADHSRAAAFLIHDGVLPSNEGRGYVLRKVLRRAARHGKMIGLDHPFLYKLTGKVAELMSDAYPELLESTQRVAAVVKAEEVRFAHTMSVAVNGFDELVLDMARDAVRRQLSTGERAALDEVQRRSQGPVGMIETIRRLRSETLEGKLLEWFKTIETLQAQSLEGSTLEWFKTAKQISLPGERLFRLYDTFGMPWDLMEELANEQGLILDRVGFDEAMQRQRERARASWKGVAKEVLSPAYAELLKKGRTVFEGYQQTTSPDCIVLALLREGQLVEELPPGAKAELVLDHTPFYAEAGGQVGDTGTLVREESHEVAAMVEDTYSPVSGLIAHRILSRAPLRVGDRLTAVVDAEKRDATKRNHTATHLLHAALRQVLGLHVKQAGSVVEPDRLRFDFSHFATVGQDEIEEIERLANAAILANTAVQTEVLELDQALESGALAFFGEKYPDRVRVVSVPDFSKELCGGTHVSRTGDIGLLKITHEGSIAAGVRRVEAVTGVKALGQYQAASNLIRELSSILKSETSDLAEKTEKLVEAQRQLEKQLESLKLKMAQAQLSDIESRVRSVKDVKVLSLQIDALDRNQMRSLADTLRQRLKSGVVVLATTTVGKVSLIVALTPDLTKRLHAGKIAQAVAQRLGGTGGGRPDLAEAGGKNPALLDTVLNEVYEIVGSML